MSVISAPLDELMEFIDQVQEWMNVNRVIDALVDSTMGPILDLADWKGPSAQMFGDMVKQAIVKELGVIVSVIDAFLGALNAVIDAIQAIIDGLNALNPFSWF